MISYYFYSFIRSFSHNIGTKIKNSIEFKYFINKNNEENNNNNNDDVNNEKILQSIDEDNIGIATSANSLLNAVIKVLLLADIVVISQIINAKNKVFLALNKIETVNSGFWVFIKLFTQYGNDMVELAHLSGERQNV